MTPYSSDYSLSVLYINDNQLDYSYSEGHSHLIYGVLPVVTLSSEIKITGGEGTASSPYKLMAIHQLLQKLVILVTPVVVRLIKFTISL